MSVDPKDDYSMIEDEGNLAVSKVVQTAFIRYPREATDDEIYEWIQWKLKEDGVQGTDDTAVRDAIWWQVRTRGTGVLRDWRAKMGLEVATIRLLNEDYHGYGVNRQRINDHVTLYFDCKGRLYEVEVIRDPDRHYRELDHGA